ncbi:hypothetical protein BDV96DRAFT_271194 [Lophiotrema nucula]|uniref:Uncharacterized protein n=1 Tax=Lophiotrema nucula TaxID=690887 RepID=A0A6A5ZQV8_9PLEO|nr:hypothetical protein BDV96DRAFT_271194 [Lophiotrema nucula]
MDQTHDIFEGIPVPGPKATPASATDQSHGKPRATNNKKTRKYFSDVQPTFMLQAPPPKLEFLDHADPFKAEIVRKKAREYVNRNKDATRRRTGTGTGLTPSTNVWVPDSGYGRDKHAPHHVASPAVEATTDVVHRRLGLSGKGNVGITPPWLTPLDITLSRFDPFNVLPDVGRPVNHIIEFSTYTGSGLYGLLILHRESCSHFLNSCPDEVPCLDDKYAWRPQQAVTTISRDNTVLGCMIAERVSYILWLFATTMIRDAMNGQWGTGENFYYYRLALMEMRKEAARNVEQFTDAFMSALACFTAAANFSGQWSAAEMHCDAMVKATKLKGQGDLLKGIRAFKPWTQKAMMWCEFHVVAQGPTAPVFPYLPPTSMLELPGDLVTEAKRLQQLTLSQLPSHLAAPLPDIILQLHELSLSTSGQLKWPMSSVQIKLDPSISRTLYNTEYELLQLLSLQKHGDSVTHLPVEILLAETCQMYIWTTIRMLPPVMKLCDLFVTRLKKALLPYTDITTAGKTADTSQQQSFGSDLGLDESRIQQAALDLQTCPYSLIWPLFLGTLVSATRPEHQWFKEQLLRYVRDSRHVKNEDDLKNVLQMFPFTGALYSLGMAGLNIDYGNIAVY